MLIIRKFSTNPKVFMNFILESEQPDTVIFELFPQTVPKTCENFIQLCKGSSELQTDKGKALAYKGSKVHRIVPGFLFQGGDFTKMNGKGGWSIYGETFDCENFQLKHSESGILSMANLGKNKNNSQFFVTFAPCPVLDGKHTVFGKVFSGMDVIKKIEAVGTASGKPRIKVRIGECGLVE